MIELQSVSKEFGSFHAVNNVSLSVRAGEFLTLLGPSGCGKTTLLRMISGFETPTRGRVWLDGKDVTDLPPYQRDVNQVFQSYALFPHLNVWNNIAFGLRSRKTPRAEMTQRIEEGIELVGLKGMERRRPEQLSGGQRQRVALARALVCQPKVLLLDEPLAALDAKLRRHMQLELKRLQQRVGITFVFVTHDQDEAIVMSDRIAVINRGQIEQIAPAGEIYLTPATRFVADFLGQANLLPVQSIQREGDQVALNISPGFTLHSLQQPAANENVLACVRPEKIELIKNPSPGAAAATIADVVFRGATSQLTLNITNGTTLNVMSANVSGGVAYRVGEPVFCRVDAADVVVLRA